MHDIAEVILYVSDAPASAQFYADLLGRSFESGSPTFKTISLPGDRILAVVQRDTVAPVAEGGPGSVELVLALSNDDDVTRLHEDWREKGVDILMAPTRAPFGLTFVAADPDGHRIRAYHPAA